MGPFLSNFTFSFHQALILSDEPLTGLPFSGTIPYTNPWALQTSISFQHILKNSILGLRHFPPPSLISSLLGLLFLCSLLGRKLIFSLILFIANIFLCQIPTPFINFNVRAVTKCVHSNQQMLIQQSRWLLSISNIW